MKELHDEGVPRNPEQSQNRYVKPAVAWEQTLDLKSLAVGCGKNDPLIPDCANFGISS